MQAIIKGPRATFSDADLVRLCRDNPGFKIERNDDGALIVSPTNTSGGAKSMEASGQLWLYSKRAGGKAFDAQTGFKTPGGGVVSPDAAWVSAERVALHIDEEAYWAIMPDVVIEVASKTDDWQAVKRKIDTYIADGAQYALGVDPRTRETYELGNRPADLTIDTDAIFDA